MLLNSNRNSIHIIIDTLALFLIGVVTHYFFDNKQLGVFWPAWALVTLTGQYLIGRYDAYSKQLFYYVTKTAIGSAPALLVSYPFLSGSDTHRLIFLLLLYPITIIILSIISYINTRSAVFNKKNRKAILFLFNRISSNARYQSLITSLQREGYKTIEYYIDLNDDDAIKNLNFSQWNRVVYDRSLLKNDDYASILLKEKIKGINIIDFVTFYSRNTGRVPLDLVDEAFLLDSGRAYFHNKHLNRLMRIIDLSVGSILFLILIIPSLIIATLIRFESKGAIIFKQERIGKNLKPFTLYKFRSMRSDAEKNGPQWATGNDSRATKVGKFLRKTHLDEIPQILNVLRGDIGLVGPRPIRMHFAEKLMKKFPYYDLRFLVKPGLTGWTQIKGPYGENEEQHRIKLEMDLFYLQNANFMLYLYILLGTGKHMITPSENSHSNFSIDT